jgi:hypothetical protein
MAVIHRDRMQTILKTAEQLLNFYCSEFMKNSVKKNLISTEGIPVGSRERHIKSNR